MLCRGLRSSDSASYIISVTSTSTHCLHTHLTNGRYTGSGHHPNPINCPNIISEKHDGHPKGNHVLHGIQQVLKGINSRCKEIERALEVKYSTKRGKREVILRVETNIRLRLVLHAVVSSVVSRSRVDRSNAMGPRHNTTA